MRQVQSRNTLQFVIIALFLILPFSLSFFAIRFCSRVLSASGPSLSHIPLKVSSYVDQWGSKEEEDRHFVYG